MRIFTDFPAGGSPAFDAPGARERIRANLAGVRAIAAIASAKGGAGKSMIAVNVAAALALKGRKIALLDADLNSPSIPGMLGIKPRRRISPEEAIEPAAGPFGLRVAWSGMIPGGEPEPISFAEENGAAPAPIAASTAEMNYAAALVRLLSRTAFGPLDAIVIDLAPGLARLHTIAALVALDAVILASHPSGLAADAARHAIEIAAGAGTPLAGLVENMAGFNCDGCRSVRPLWPAGNLPDAARAGAVPILARLPFDSRIAESSDRGVPFIRNWADTPAARELENLANRIDSMIQSRATAAGESDRRGERAYNTNDAAK